MTPDSWIEYFYSHFFARASDIAYTFSGGLFICILEYSLRGEIFFLPNQLSLEMFGFLVGSYIISIGLVTLTTMIPFKIYEDKRGLPTPYTNKLVFIQNIIKQYDVKIINLRERDEYQRVVGLSIGATLLWGGLSIILIRFVIFALGKLYHFPYKSEYDAASSTNYIIAILAGLGIFLGLWILNYVERGDGNIEKKNKELAAHI